MAATSPHRRSPSAAASEEVKTLIEQCNCLQHKLTTKTEALLRVGKDLEECERERDLWRAKANTFERNLERIEKELRENKEEQCRNRLGIQQELEDKVRELAGENDALRRTNIELKAETRDLQKDCRTLRQQLARKEVEALEGASSPLPNDTPSVVIARRSTEESGSLDNYEKLFSELDLQSVLGAKEELVLENDALNKKIQSLSSELSFLLNGDARRDWDDLVAENRFLKAQLDSAQAESENIKALLSKYRKHAEQRRSSKSDQSVAEDRPEEKSSVAVINMKQIRQILASNAIELSEGDYRALSTVLLDLCNDKEMALTHQRRANKILGSRLSEVEAKLRGAEGKSPRSVSPRNADQA